MGQKKLTSEDWEIAQRQGRIRYQARDEGDTWHGSLYETEKAARDDAFFHVALLPSGQRLGIFQVMLDPVGVRLAWRRIGTVDQVGLYDTDSSTRKDDEEEGEKGG